MKFILIMLLLFHVSAHAQRKLNPQSFQINVRPPLNAIINDFYVMLGLFPDFPKELVVILEELDTLTADKEALRESCPRTLDKKCMGSIKRIRLKLSSIQARTLVLMSRQKMSASLHLSSLGGFRLITEFQSALDQIKGELENASLLYKARLPLNRPTYEIIKQLDELNTIISISVVEFIPFLYKEDFRHFYFNFVNPIQLHISKNLNYEFLNRNVNNLNFSLNLLVMNLTKRNKKTPEGMAPYLNLIHNRWNNILRYYY